MVGALQEDEGAISGTSGTSSAKSSSVPRRSSATGAYFTGSALRSFRRRSTARPRRFALRKPANARRQVSGEGALEAAVAYHRPR